MRVFNFLILLLFLLPTSCENLLGDKTVIDGSDTSNSETSPLTVKIFTAASDSGVEVTTVTLTDNEPITLFAVGVNSDDEFVESLPVTWSVSNSLGELSTTLGTSATFTPNAGDGAEIITATHATLGSDSTDTIAIEYTVSNLASLEAWYRADFGVTYNGSNEVTNWADQSDNTNDATQPGVSTLRPLFVDAAIGGKPALRFDGGDDFLTTAGSIVNGNSARTIFIVSTNITDTGTYNGLLDLSDTVPGVGTNYGITTEVAVRISGNRVFNEGIAPGETKLLTVTNAAGTTAAGIDTYLDGVLSTQLSVSANTINTAVNPAFIGQAAFASSNCHCDIAEIVVYSTQLSPADRQDVEDYLANKYGL